MKQQHFEIKAAVKKFVTQGSKGGSIVLTMEMALTDENALLAGSQNKECLLTLDFDNDSVEKATGQEMLFTAPTGLNAIESGEDLEKKEEQE